MEILKIFKSLPAQEKRLTIPNCLTLVRLISTPVIVLAMFKLYWGVAFWLIIFSALTDLLDGYIARRFNQKTFLGACLDPIADKLLILSVYFMLAFKQSPLFSIPLWFVILVLLKELLLIAGAIFLYIRQWQAKHLGANEQLIELQPTLLGKLTMLVQTLFIVWLFACYFMHWLPVKTYYTALGAVVCLVLSSLCEYATIGFRYLRFYLD